jgi:hypothetical protein
MIFHKTEIGNLSGACSEGKSSNIKPKMPTISREEHARSTEFLKTLNRLMDFVEDVLPFINEQQYLLACDDLKSLNDIHDRSSVREIYEYIAHEVRNNPTYHQHEQRTKMKIIDKQTQLSDASKLANGYKVCPKHRLRAWAIKNGKTEFYMNEVVDVEEEAV